MRHISFDGAVKIYFVSPSRSTHADNEVESSPLSLERWLEMVGKPNNSCKRLLVLSQNTRVCFSGVLYLVLTSVFSAPRCGTVFTPVGPGSLSSRLVSRSRSIAAACYSLIEWPWLFSSCWCVFFPFHSGLIWLILGFLLLLFLLLLVDASQMSPSLILFSDLFDHHCFYDICFIACCGSLSYILSVGFYH